MCVSVMDLAQFIHLDTNFDRQKVQEVSFEEESQ